MSTKLHDVAAAALLGASVAPDVFTTSQNGAAVDLISGDGNGFAILITGAIAGGTTIGGKVQESADGTTWSDISDATFTDTTTSDATQALTFARTERYARCVVTLSGGSPSAGVCALIGQQKKVS